MKTLTKEKANNQKVEKMTAYTWNAKDDDAFKNDPLILGMLQMLQKMEAQGEVKPITPTDLDLDEPILLDLTGIEVSEYKIALAKRMNVKSFPKLVFALSSEDDDAELFVRLPNKFESEYDTAENHFLISYEIFHPLSEYIKFEDAAIHPTVWGLMQQKFGIDFSAKDTLTICKAYIEAWDLMKYPYYDVIPSIVYNKAA